MLPGFMEYTDVKPAYVYLLYHFDKLVYVGSTVNLSGRVREHGKTTRLVFNRVYYKSLARLDQARDLEAKLILELQPPANIVGKTVIDIKLGKPIDLAAIGIDVRRYGVNPFRRV